jgi:group I intron endonuclease
MKKYYVYRITNWVTKWVYIGSTQYNPIERWKSHESHMRNKSHNNMQLREDYEKHGASSFIFEILEIFDNKEDMILLEQLAIRECISQGNCYNIMHNDRKIWKQNTDLYWEDRLARRKQILAQLEPLVKE